MPDAASCVNASQTIVPTPIAVALADAPVHGEAEDDEYERQCCRRRRAGEHRSPRHATRSAARIVFDRDRILISR